MPATQKATKSPSPPRWQRHGGANHTIPASLHGTVKRGADISHETSYVSDSFITSAPTGTKWTATPTGQNIFNRLAFQTSPGPAPITSPKAP